MLLNSHPGQDASLFRTIPLVVYVTLLVRFIVRIDEVERSRPLSLFLAAPIVRPESYLPQLGTCLGLRFGHEGSWVILEDFVNPDENIREEVTLGDGCDSRMALTEDVWYQPEREGGEPGSPTEFAPGSSL